MGRQGFDILLSIEDRKMLQSNVCRIPNEITENTKNRCTTPGLRSKGKRRRKPTQKLTSESDSPVHLFFLS
jgi:hypothetical protein